MERAMKQAAKAKDASPHWVFTFGAGRAEGDAAQRDLLGGKGAYLAEMSRLGLPVPPGLTISSEVCAAYYQADKTLPKALLPMVSAALDVVGKVAGARFGDVDNPLLVSVRSGSRASMPGMMDTVLNLGLNDQTVEGLARRSSDRRFAYDTYRRFIQMYADVVLGIDHDLFEEALENYKSLNGFEMDSELKAEHWSEVIGRFKALVEQELGQPFPQDLHVQLWGAIAAVFGSWHNARAIAYRRLHDIPDAWGTAVTVQAMVFGNMGERSATGVVFTRNPSTGANELYGEYLVNAQGEDVVAGLRTPQSLTEAARQTTGDKRPSLEGLMPDVYADLKAACAKLEAHFRDIQDIEFTVEEGKLWVLQSRSGKRSMQAALKIAVDMASRRSDDREGGRARHRCRPARSASPSDARSGDAEARHRQGSAGLPRRRLGRARVRRRRSRASEGARSHADLGAGRDVARGCARHACRGGRHHHPRRHDEPRSGGGARHGAAMRGRRRLGADRP